MSSATSSTPLRRFVASLLAVLVLVTAMPGPLSWTCVAASGALQCCCVESSAAEQSTTDEGCCLDLRPPGDEGEGEEDGEPPCDCGGDDPDQLPIEAKEDGGEPVLAGPPSLLPSFEVPGPIQQLAGADYGSQRLCTGPPLYVLFQVFLI